MYRRSARVSNRGTLLRRKRYPLEDIIANKIIRNNFLRKVIRKRRVAKRVAVSKVLYPKFGYLSRKISKYVY